MIRSQSDADAAAEEEDALVASWVTLDVVIEHDDGDGRDESLAACLRIE